MVNEKGTLKPEIRAGSSKTGRIGSSHHRVISPSPLSACFRSGMASGIWRCQSFYSLTHSLGLALPHSVMSVDGLEILKRSDPLETRMASQQEDLRRRTKQFAIAVIRLVRGLPNKPESWVIGKQLLRSATSIAANYRAAGRARSHVEFIAKIGVVVEEADETVFWLELLMEAAVSQSRDLPELLREANELVAIFAASQRTARQSTSNSGTAQTPIRQS